MNILGNLFGKVPMDRRQQKTRAAIYEAMTKLLMHKRFEELTVQDIIDEANIGRSTFYSHFETKESLLDQMCNEMFAHVFSHDLTPEKSHDFSNTSDIETRLTHVLWHIKDHGNNIKAIMGGETEEVFTRYFKDYLRNACAQSIQDIDADVPEEFKEQFVIGSFVETVKWWIGDGMTMSPEETVRNYLKMMR